MRRQKTKSIDRKGPSSPATPENVTGPHQK